MEPLVVVEIVGIALGVVAWTLGVIKFILDKVDEKTAEADFLRHVDQNEKDHNALWAEMRLSRDRLASAITDLGVQMNGRLDNLLMLLTKQNHD